MDSARYALPECPRCGGKGSITRTRDDGALDYLLCPCAVIGQRRVAADAWVERLFPGRMRQMTLATYQTGGLEQNALALRVARNFVDDWPSAVSEGWMLGFTGPPRAGKTHLATAIAIACLRRYLARPHVLSVPLLLREERRTYSQRSDGSPSPVDMAMRADLLVLDDLGAEYIRSRTDARSGVEWVDEQLYLVLDERVRLNRPVVYTTNLSLQGLRDTLSDRVFSRLERAQVGLVEVVPTPGAGVQAPEAMARLLRPRTEDEGEVI